MKPTYEADSLVHETYHHLIERWCGSLPHRFLKWFRSLCSPNNLRYTGLAGISRKIAIYRPTLIDLYPELEMRPGPGVVALGGQSERSPPPLSPDMTEISLFVVFQGLTWRHYNENKRLARGGRCTIARPPSRKCPGCEERVENPPFLISLHNFSDMAPNIWNPFWVQDTSISDAEMMAYQERERNETFSRLLVYEDELEIVTKNFEVIMRPILRNKELLDASQIIPRGLWHHTRLQGLAADLLMREDAEHGPRCTFCRAYHCPIDRYFTT